MLLLVCSLLALIWIIFLNHRIEEDEELENKKVARIFMIVLVLVVQIGIPLFAKDIGKDQKLSQPQKVQFLERRPYLFIEAGQLKEIEILAPVYVIFLPDNVTRGYEKWYARNEDGITNYYRLLGI